jgi:type II secretory ATPase GspE/PulE/Tfp pilus assembly ATPase PilB-like protein
MRQDPDIIMIGEIRDQETANLAINAALTGHMVLATVHTNSSSGTIARLMDMGVESFLLVSTLKVAVGQRLVRKLTDATKDPYTLTANEKAELGKHADLDRILATMMEEGVVKPGSTWNNIPFYHAKTVSEHDDGYKGRAGIHEVLPMSPIIKDMVMASATSDDIEEQAKKEGMLTMLEDGTIKLRAGSLLLKKYCVLLMNRYCYAKVYVSRSDCNRGEG